MTRICLDTETRSRADLKKLGPYPYVADPDFRILILTYSVDGAAAEVTTDPEEITDLLLGWYYDPDAAMVAHNAAFDRVVCSEHLRRAGHLTERRYMDPARWDCTAARAAEAGRPRHLAQVAKALGCMAKDTDGQRLIRLFCKPNRKGEWNGAESHPEDWQKFIDYAVTDTDVLSEVDAKLPGWPTKVERQAWVLDQRINDLGIAIDVDLATRAQEAASYNRMADELRVMAATGIENPGSVQQMTAWLGGAVPNLQEATVKAALAGNALTPLQREVLELRQELALSSASKFTAALDAVGDDGRVRGMFTFFGATTGRWSSRGPQFQNQPRAAFKPDTDPKVDPEKAQREVDAQVDAAIVDLKLGLGASPLTLKKLVRPMFTGPFTCLDFASIEARVIAWLADETWALGAFNSGQDIYVATAEKMGGLTRQQGKTAVLALGFAGGIDALKRMAGDRAAWCSVAGVPEDATDEEIDEGLTVVKDAWREANPRIVRLWKRLINSVQEGGQVGGHLAIRRVGSSMRLHLPSGRAIHYHGVHRERFTVPDPNDSEKRIAKTAWRCADPSKPGLRTTIWSGLLVENAVQAIARDVLVGAMLRLTEHGYTIAGHVHDEVVIEGEHDVEEIAKLMCEQPSWGAGLPLDAEGFTTYRYRKG